MILVKEMPCGRALLLEFKTVIQCFNNTFKEGGFFGVFLFFIRKYIRFAVSLLSVQI